MFVVTIKTPLPGVVATTFVFYNENEAYEFQSCLASRYPDTESELSQAGEARDVFESWSF